jgi:hypothetical protein
MRKGVSIQAALVALCLALAGPIAVPRASGAPSPMQEQGENLGELCFRDSGRFERDVRGIGGERDVSERARP